MKKILISTCVISLMSFTTYQTVENYQLRQVYENLNELEYYVNEDTFNGNMDSTVTQLYLDLIHDSEDKIELIMNNK